MMRDGCDVRKLPRELRGAAGDDVVEDRAEPEEGEAQRQVHEQPEEPAVEAVLAAHRGQHGALRARGRGDLGTGHSYTCRYLRTRRIETALRISVMRKSVKPTTKIVSYSIEPVGMSPRAVAAMNAAIDW